MAEYLSSWQGSSYNRITAFVNAVTDEHNSDYVEPHDRIATFDNDGTLWVEKPYYTQLVFLLDRLKDLATDRPEWHTCPPYSDALSGDPQRLKQLTIPEILSLTAATHTGMTQAEFMAIADAFLNRALHPRFNRLYTQLVYQPMLELIRYLHDRQFQVYICSAGGLDFMRSFSKDVYGIAPERVMGSSIRKTFEVTETGVELRRQPELVQPINDGGSKPELIERHVGRRPILAVGNANGDLEMLQYTTNSNRRSLAILLCHDDAEREYSYNSGAERVQAMAQQNGWLTVSMRSDFQTIFPEK